MPPVKPVLASRLFKSILLWYILFAGLVVGAVMMAEYVGTKSRLLHELRDYELSYGSSLAAALWAMDLTALKKQVDSIQTLPHVAGVKILDHNAEEVFVSTGSFISEEGGSEVSSGLYSYRFPIIYHHQTGEEGVGFAEIFTSRDIIIGIIKIRFFLMLIVVVVMLVALWVIIFTATQRILGKPLSRLTALTQELDFSNLGDLRESDSTDRKTEIEILENAIIKMIRRLAKTKRKLSKLNHTLEKLVDARTADLNIEVAEHRQNQKLLQESEERFRELADLMPQPIWEADLEGTFTYANRRGFRLFGYTQEELDQGIKVTDLFVPEDRERVIKNFSKSKKGEKFDDQEYVCLKNDGSSFPALAYASRIFKNEKLVGIRGLVIDITERKQSERELRKLSRAVESSSSAVIITDATYTIEYVNPKFTEISGYTREEAIGKTPEFLQSEEAHGRLYYDLLKSIATEGEWKGELYSRKKDGSYYWARNSISVIRDKRGAITHYVSIHDDVSRDIELNKQISFQASHDVLTGLINRREFERRAERLISSFQRGQDDHAFCFIDLDQFKVINDTCGHAAGDKLLSQLGDVLQGAVRHRDTLARLGGDEFGILMEHCSLDKAQRVAESLASAINEFHFAWEDHLFRISASMGLVSINESTPSLTELLKQADAACYMAKDLGRNRIHIYRPDDFELAQRQGEMHWVARINQALEDNRFCLYAQAIVPLDGSSGGKKHFELLLRMVDESGDIILPGAFLPAAERYDLVGQLDSWVTKNAFCLLADNPDFVGQIDFISINLSGQSLNSSAFLELIVSQMKTSGVDASKICFEITETVAISNLAAAATFISVLRKLGCRFALDDFGSGLSSFGYLKNLQVDYLKIDGMFVRGMVDDAIDRAMVKSINDIGQVMGMKTIAEFVENDEIKVILREIGVNYAQGYGMGKPQPLSDLLEKQELKSNVSPFPTVK